MIAPTTEAAMAKAVAAAKGPLQISGGGTHLIGRPVVGEPLSTAGLSGISLYDPGALTLVVKAGTPLADIETALAKENQRLAFEPIDHRALLGTKGEPTIGGAVAANTSGPRRVAVGACRDFLLGVRFVDGSGQIIKNGGRVMKNVTGYDLVKLMAGSYGTLGILTEVSMKVLPAVEAEATLRFKDLNVADAVDAMSSALGSPFDVTGAAHDPTVDHTLLRIEGFDGSVAYRTGELAKHLTRFGAADVITGEDCKEIWRNIRDVQSLAAQSGDIWRFSVKPSDALALVDAIAPTAFQLDWGGGLVWATTDEGTNLRAKMGDLKGHATLIRASKATRAAIQPFHPEPAPLAAISNGLRDKFDPRGILNPGLMT